MLYKKQSQNMAFENWTQFCLAEIISLFPMCEKFVLQFENVSIEFYSILF